MYSPGFYTASPIQKVLLSETIIRAVNLKLVTNDQISNFDPVVMFAIPRLAIVAGLIHMPDCVNLTDAEGGFRWFRQKSFQMNYIKQELMLLNDADVVHLETMLVDSEPQCEREERRNGKMIMENVSDKSSDLNGLSSLLATLPLTEEGNMRSSEVEDGVNMEERNDDKDNQSPPLIDQQNLPLHQQEKESKQILFKHEPSSSECVKDVPIATYTTSSLTSTSSSTSQNQQHEYLSSTAAVATAATASEEPLSHFQDKSEKSTSILPPPSCISNQGKSREEKGKAVATGNQIDVGSYNVLMASSASPSSSSKASDTATYFKPAVPLDRLKCMYRAICAIADDLQSGPRAKEFVGVLQKTFSMHS